jgi:hypothetical protein
MKRQVRQFCRFHSKILERLRFLVYLLIHELPVDLVGRVKHLPPQKLIQIMGNRLEEWFWNVDVPSLLDNFFIDKLGNLR